MNRPQQVETLPLQRVNPDTNLMIRDVAKVQWAPRRVRSIAARCSAICDPGQRGRRRPGRATARIGQAKAAAGKLPRGVRVGVRGQVAPMTEMFHT